ncbi:DDE Tnp IS1595 domain-containing protein [Aphis craccivora]|uniref:DDE Tnp IS1595 domain-containing protein n=1 Tax=Aphis craccivora TaxID=307492 RepID=A0A6G0Y8J6_APHCR|nr:DDE Tnp IS1595 domain-containing protein [Aphis craccivora]
MLLYDIFEHKTDGPVSLSVIEKLQSWNLLAREGVLKCNNEKRDKDTLLTAINDWILPGTTIISVCWKSYQCLEDEGFFHLTVNHSIQFKNPETGAHTNNVEGMWRHASRQGFAFPILSQKTRFYGGYLTKFMFLKRCRILSIEPLTEFFKLADELYDPKAIQENNLLFLSDGEESSETDGSDEDL